jgi:hypothetical protein
MNILALDPASYCAWCLGEAGATPRSGVVRLKRPDDDPEIAAFNLLAFLQERRLRRQAP